MLQDLEYGRLENEYRPVPPIPGDSVVCIRGNEILIARGEEDAPLLPSFDAFGAWEKGEDWKPWREEELHFLFRMHEKSYYLYMGASGICPDEGYAYTPVRGLRQMAGKETCFAIMTAWHLYCWYRDSRFCGRCGEKTVHDQKERMMRCPACGNMIFPRINPAVIVAVTDGDRIVFTKYAGRGFTHHALIAGFTEIGETLEQTVEREVMEEVGLKVNHIRYYKSQPWGVDGNILTGFFCDLDGDDTIRMDENELSLAQWYPRNDLPAKDDGISLTREMMRIFGEGREPKWNA